MKTGPFDTLLSRLDTVLRIGAGQRVRQVAGVTTINDHRKTPLRRQRRQFLVRLGHGTGWLLCVLVTWIIVQYAFAVVVLIGCAVREGVFNMAHVILRLSAVKARTGLSRSTIYARIAQGNFPAAIAIGARARGWVEWEMEQWIEDRLGQRPAARMQGAAK